MLMGVSVITQNLQAVAQDEDGQGYDGPYAWQGEEYDLYERTERDTGYIDEYTNKEQFCTSYVIIPGMSLMSTGFLGPLYLFILFYLFLGIQIIADEFVDAINSITSTTYTIFVVDPDTGMKEPV